MKFRRKAEQISGFLDQGTSITGELQFAGTLRIDGNFHGSISKGEILIIGERAVVHADIKVGEIEIHGKVFGNVEAERRAEIFPTGILRGDLHTPVLIVGIGGVFDGKSHMPSDAVGSPSASHHAELVESDIRHDSDARADFTQTPREN